MCKLRLFLAGMLMFVGVYGTGVNRRVAACRSFARVALQVATNSGAPTSVAAGAQGVVAAHWHNKLVALERRFNKERYQEKMNDPKE